MTTKEITMNLINETLNETLDGFEKEIKKLESLRKEIPEERDTYETLKPMVDFTYQSMRCAQFLESLVVLFEDAPKLACIHLFENEHDKFKEDKKELLITNKLYERYQRLFKIYDDLTEDI